MSGSNTGTTMDRDGGTGFTYDELTEELADANNEISLLIAASLPQDPPAVCAERREVLRSLGRGA